MPVKHPQRTPIEIEDRRRKTERDDSEPSDDERERERAAHDEYHRDRFTTDDDDHAGRQWRMRTHGSGWLPICTAT